MRRDSTRESERELQRPLDLACTIQKKRRNKIRHLWLWLVCCSLLPTCYFHQPFTSIRGKSIIELIFDGDLTICAVHCVCVQNSELDFFFFLTLCFGSLCFTFIWPSVVHWALSIRNQSVKSVHIYTDETVERRLPWNKLRKPSNHNAPSGEHRFTMKKYFTTDLTKKLNSDRACKNKVSPSTWKL